MLILLSIMGGLLTIAVVVIVTGLGISILGNGKRYSVKNTDSLENSPLKSMRILFLGSSITVGLGSMGESFVDFLEKKDGIIPIKKAVNGTTLVDNGRKSYIQRLKKVGTSEKIDAFVCQLSTNDARKKLPLGKISETKNYDTHTTVGAIEAILNYARSTWNCPVIFLTSTRYNNSGYDPKHYDKMVYLLLEIQKKWNIGVIDLWNNTRLNDISKKEHKLYSIDGIHPTRAGYKLWWLPAIETYLYSYLGEGDFKR